MIEVGTYLRAAVVVLYTTTSAAARSAQPNSSGLQHLVGQLVDPQVWLIGSVLYNVAISRSLFSPDALHMIPPRLVMWLSGI